MSQGRFQAFLFLRGVPGRTFPMFLPPTLSQTATKKSIILINKNRFSVAAENSFFPVKRRSLNNILLYRIAITFQGSRLLLYIPATNDVTRICRSWLLSGFSYTILFLLIYRSRNMSVVDRISRRDITSYFISFFLFYFFFILTGQGVTCDGSSSCFVSELSD